MTGNRDDKPSGIRETGSRPEPEGLTPEEQAFRAELLESAERLDQPSSDLTGRLLSEIGPKLSRDRSGTRWFASRRTWATAVAALAAAAAVVMVSTRRHEPPAALVQAERLRHSSKAPASVAVEDPCAHRLHADGTAPLIDDFEDGNERSLPFEGRGQRWILVLDTDPEGAARSLVPQPVPDPSRANHWAMHLAGPELRSWGAQAMLSFFPHACYDASAYAGITFRAKGPGRIFVGAEGVRQTPRKWGGTCETDCYNDHVARVNLGRDWQTFELVWADLHQRGYEGEPLDVTSVSNLLFLVRAEDTPFDVWIDDVAFLTRTGRSRRP